MDIDLPSRLRDHARARGLFPEPGTVLLAVSGGPDSVAMLDLMSRAAGELGVELAVAHVDHGIAEESPDVAEHVLGLAVRYKLPGYLASLNLGAETSETRARRERYAALRDLQRRTGARYLATAHHAGDQAETILYRLFRGSGTAGLAGIPERGPNGLVRPLLSFAKSDLAAWLAAGSRTGETHADPANLNPQHDRSWIRTEVLPLLRRRFADIDGDLLDAGRHAAADRDAWRVALRALKELDFRLERGVAEVARAALLGYDNTLSEALLRALAREAGCVLGPRRAAHFWRLARDAPSGRTFDLGQHWVAEIAFGRLRIFHSADACHDQSPTRRWGESHVGRVRWGWWEITWSHEAAGVPQRDSFVTWVTGGEGEVRGLLPGDRIRPLRGAGRRRVSRVLMEGRIPLSERGEYPVLTRGDAVIWLPGICRGEAALPGVGDPAMRLEARAQQPG